MERGWVEDGDALDTRQGDVLCNLGTETRRPTTRTCWQPCASWHRDQVRRADAVETLIDALLGLIDLHVSGAGMIVVYRQ